MTDLMDDAAKRIGEQRLLLEQMAEALRECAEDLESRFAPDRDGWRDDEAMRLDHKARKALAAYEKDRAK